MSSDTNQVDANKEPATNQCVSDNSGPVSLLNKTNKALSTHVLPDGVIKACSQIAADWASYIVPIISALYIINNIPSSFKEIAFWVGWIFILVCSFLGLCSSFVIVRENTLGLTGIYKAFVAIVAILFSVCIIACLAGQGMIDWAKSHP
ncbi:hypothetical protein WKH71_05225 [Pantoea agglomerans]|uniref:hypothetical protein n=2 Tax=Enterobacter agglomerans TaxID=549 RepID=UPI003C79ECC3